MGCALSRSNPSRVSCFYINTSHSTDKTTTHTMLERDRDREGRKGNWWHMWCLLRRSWTGIMWARIRSVWFASVRRSSPQFGSARFDSGLASCCLVNWRCPALRLPHDDDAASLICINKHIIYILLHTHTHRYHIYICDICVHIVYRSGEWVRLRRVLMPSTHIRLFALMSSGRRIRRRSRSRDDPIRCDPIRFRFRFRFPFRFCFWMFPTAIAILHFASRVSSS